MEKRLKRAVIGILCLVYTGVIGAKVIESIAVYSVKELINDHTFMYRQDVVNGSVRNHWMVDDKQVDQQTYDQAYAQAVIEERRKEQRIQQERRERERREKEHTRTAVYTKLLEQHRCAIKQWYDRIAHNNLEPYAVFDQTTFDDAEAYQTTIKTVFDTIDTVVRGELEENILFDDDFLKTIELMPDKMQTFFYKTVNNAVAQCDDTRMLKHLLELLA